MREMQNRAAGRLINATTFHADETVFDQIQPADAIGLAQRVQFGQQGGGGKFFAVDRYRIALFEPDLDITRLVGRLFRLNGALIDTNARYYIPHPVSSANCTTTAVHTMKALSCSTLYEYSQNRAF